MLQILRRFLEISFNRYCENSTQYSLGNHVGPLLVKCLLESIRSLALVRITFHQEDKPEFYVEVRGILKKGITLYHSSGP